MFEGQNQPFQKFLAAQGQVSQPFFVRIDFFSSSPGFVFRAVNLLSRSIAQANSLLMSRRNVMDLQDFSRLI